MPGSFRQYLRTRGGLVEAALDLLPRASPAYRRRHRRRPGWAHRSHRPSSPNWLVDHRPVPGFEFLAAAGRHRDRIDRPAGIFANVTMPSRRRAPPRVRPRLAPCCVRFPVPSAFAEMPVRRPCGQIHRGAIASHAHPAPALPHCHATALASSPARFPQHQRLVVVLAFAPASTWPPPRPTPRQ